VGTAVPVPSGEVAAEQKQLRKQRGGTMEQEKEQRRVTVDGGAGHRAGAAGTTDEAGASG
jgi:hypothetical protein